MLLLRLSSLVVTACLFISALAQQTTQAPTFTSAAAPQIKLDEQINGARISAMGLFTEGKAAEALSGLEKVIAAIPNDVDAQRRLGVCLVLLAANTPDPAQRKALRVRARAELLKARALSNSSDLVRVLLAGIPQDGADPLIADNAEAHRLIVQGEAAFGAGHYDAADEAYLKALAIDPNNYDALLFMGDSFFNRWDFFDAVEWFAATIAADPERGTAYRYWGDILMKQLKFAAARDLYIQAVITQPYYKLSWKGVSTFADGIKQPPTWYQFKSPHSFQQTSSAGNVALNPDTLGKKDGSTAWMAYPMTRSLWQNGKFAKEYPKENQYRHSLKEEYDALSAVAKTAEELSAGKKGEKLNDELVALVKLYKAGLLEPYILYNGADEGISQDYIAYRSAHRNVLVRYLSEVVLPQAPPDGSTR